MSHAYPLVIAPHPVFSKISIPVESITTKVEAVIEGLLATMYREAGVGIAAPMIGISQRIIAFDLQPEGKPEPMVMINPEITYRSSNTQQFTEASLSFPGISAEITRPQAISVRYMDRSGVVQTCDAEDFRATVIQHEIDYLEGRVFLHYLSPMKRNMLLKKMEKFKKKHGTHVHGAGCGC